MLRTSMVCLSLLLGACPSDGGGGVAIETIPFPGLPGGGTTNATAYTFDDQGGAWMQSQTGSLYHLVGSGWVQLPGMVNTSNVTMSWDTTSDSLFVLLSSTLYVANLAHNLTTRWQASGPEFPTQLLGVSGPNAWVLARNNQDGNTYLVSVDQSGLPTTHHSGALTGIGTEPQGLQLPDGRLLIVHDPIDGASAWIANPDATLTPVWPCNPSCEQPPKFQIGVDGAVMAVGEDKMLDDFNLSTGAIGTERVSLNWPVIGKNMPANQAFSPVGAPVVLDDGRVFVLMLERVPSGSVTTSTLLGSVVDGNLWREISTGLSASLTLEQEIGGVIWFRDQTVGTQGLARLRL